MEAALRVAGATMADVVKVNAYLRDMQDFAAFNEIYRTFFSASYPARTTVQSDLNIPLEIDVVAVLALAGGWWLMQENPGWREALAVRWESTLEALGLGAAGETEGLVASGFVEAREVLVTTARGGRLAHGDGAAERAGTGNDPHGDRERQRPTRSEFVVAGFERIGHADGGEKRRVGLRLADRDARSGIDRLQFVFAAVHVHARMVDAHSDNRS